MVPRRRIDAGAPVRRSRAASSGPSRAGRGVVVGLVALVGLGAASIAAPAIVRADATDELRAAFVEAPPDSWDARLDAWAKEPGRLGAVVGPLLRDRRPARTAAAAHVAAWLCDHPAAPRAALDDDLLRRAGGDPAFLAALRARLVADGGGWARLMQLARGVLVGSGADPALGVAAAWLLRHEATASNAADLLDAWELGEDANVRATAGESLAVLLGTSFSDPTEARRSFEAHRGRPLLEWVRDLSAAKDAPDAPRMRRLVAEARLNVERATTPDELRRYLLASETPWPEVRALAAKRLESVDPGDGAFVPLFVEAASVESDVATLSALLDSAERLGARTGTAGRELARRTAERLDARPSPGDDLAVRLLAILGRLGSAEQLRHAYGTLAAQRSSRVVLSAWVDAAAECRGCGAELRALHGLSLRRSAGGGAGSDESALRVQAIDALARSGAASESELRESAAFLADVLGGGAGGVGSDVGSPAERAAAARALESFAGETAVSALEARAVDPAEDVVLARLAASVVGRIGAKIDDDVGAIPALVRIARSSGSLAVRTSAIEDLAVVATGDPGDDETVRLRRMPAVLGLRAGLDRTAPLEVRRAAAMGAATIGDGGALGGVLLLLREVLALEPAPAPEAGASASVDVTAAAERLVRAIAAQGEATDEAIAVELRDLLDAGEREGALAVRLAEAAVDAGAGRARLQELRGRLFLRRSGRIGRGADERAADLERGRTVLVSAIRGTSASDRQREEWVRVIALHERVLLRLLAARVAQAEDAIADATTDAGARRLRDVRRELDGAVEATLDARLAPAVLASAIALDERVLDALRAAAAVDVRRAALIDSADAATRSRVERADGSTGPVPGADAIDRARAWLVAAEALGPTDAEVGAIAEIRKRLGPDAPPTPK